MRLTVAITHDEPPKGVLRGQWSNQEVASLFLELDKPENKIVLFGKQNASNESKGRVYHRIAFALWGQQYGDDPDGFQKKVKAKWESLCKKYHELAKQFKTSDLANIRPDGPDDTTPETAKASWEHALSRLQWFPYLHCFLRTGPTTESSSVSSSARASASPPASPSVRPSVGPSVTHSTPLQAPSPLAAEHDLNSSPPSRGSSILTVSTVIDEGEDFHPTKRPSANGRRPAENRDVEQRDDGDLRSSPEVQVLEEDPTVLTNAQAKSVAYSFTPGGSNAVSTEYLLASKEHTLALKELFEAANKYQAQQHARFKDEMLILFAKHQMFPLTKEEFMAEEYSIRKRNRKLAELAIPGQSADTQTPSAKRRRTDSPTPADPPVSPLSARPPAPELTIAESNPSAVKDTVHSFNAPGGTTTHSFSAPGGNMVHSVNTPSGTMVHPLNTPGPFENTIYPFNAPGLVTNQVNGFQSMPWTASGFVEQLSTSGFAPPSA